MGGSERRKLGCTEEEGVGVLHASLNQSFLLPGKERKSTDIEDGSFYPSKGPRTKGCLKPILRFDVKSILTCSHLHL